jgi:hypothetical protein
MSEPEYLAVRHLLSAPLVAARTAPYIGDDDFDFEGLEAERERLSGGQELLVRIAYELWHAQKAVGLWEVARRLDAPTFARVVEALRLARSGRIVLDQALDAERLAA